MKVAELKILLYNYIKECNEIESEYVDLENNNFYYEKIINSLSKCLLFDEQQW